MGYRDKYEEAKNLCNRIMNYVKENKSSQPAPHHPIHYGCYARLGTKYIKLSLDRYNRSKVNVQQKLDKVIREKRDLQNRIDELHKSKHVNHENSDNLRKLNELNQSIQKLEKQLLKKEAIIKEKDKQLIHTQNEIKSLKNELKMLKKSNPLRTASKTEEQSAAKLLSQNIVNEDGK